MGAAGPGNYSLSTIAQTLAGALAVMVAVVLFRLQGVEDIIGAGDARARTLLGEGKSLRQVARILEVAPSTLSAAVRQSSRLAAVQPA
jgi:hypothetical protein